MSNYIKKKILLHSGMSENNGFALSELLFAILIVALSGLVIIAGINVSIRSYSRISELSNATIVLDMYKNAIRKGFSTAEIQDEELSYMGSPVIYSNNYKSFGVYENDNGKIVFTYLKVRAGVVSKVRSVQLIPYRVLNLYTYYKSSIVPEIHYEITGRTISCEITLCADSHSIIVEDKIKIIPQKYLVKGK